MKTLAEVIKSWDAWANSAGYDEKNPDLQSCVKEIKEAYAAEISTPPPRTYEQDHFADANKMVSGTYEQGAEDMRERAQAKIEDCLAKCVNLNTIEVLAALAGEIRALPTQPEGEGE